MKAQGVDGTIEVKDGWVTITKRSTIDVKVSTIARIHYEPATSEKYGYLQVGDDNNTVISFDEMQEKDFVEIRSLIKRI